MLRVPELRGSTIGMRFTVEERELLERAAKADRRNLSEYVRARALTAAAREVGENEAPKARKSTRKPATQK